MKKQNFNTGWLFSAVGGEQAMKPVTLPHDAMLYEKRSKNAATAGACGYFPGGAYVYIKRFPVPEEWREQSAVLEFEAVYQNAQVFVNGTLAAEQRYGYTNFFVALDRYLKYGEENEIKVIADNSAVPNSRWYSGSGIYRNVNLFLGDRSHIIPDGLLISTSGNDTAHVKASVTGGDTVRVSILDGGSVAAQAEAPVKDGAASVDIPVSQPRLWDADHPELYLCRTELLKDGEVVDTAKERFGFRTLSWNVKGFFVNGQETLLRGACIHHDNGVLGACCYEDAEWRKIRILKENGYNAIRSAHNPCSKFLLDACDHLGVLVMDEYIDHWYIHKTEHDYVDYFMEWWKQDLKDMVDKDYNHPSVILYSTGNEVSETAQKKGIKLTADLTNYLHQLDDTRPVTCGVNIFFNFLSSVGFGVYSDEKAKKEAEKAEKLKAAGAAPKKKKAVGSEFFNNMAGLFGDNFMKLGATLPPCDWRTRDAFANMDVAGYNYGIFRYEGDLKKYPNRLILGSETFCSDAYRFRELAKKEPRIVGDFVWAGMDYLGEVGIGSWEYQDYAPDFGHGVGWVSAGSGRIDLTGLPLGEALYTRVALERDKGPYIAVCPVNHTDDKHSPSAWKMSNAIPSWSWRGCAGKRANVEVYARAHSVELLVNGKRVGKKELKNDCMAKFRCIYEDGTVEAVSYDSHGHELGRCSLRTASPETQLRAVPEEGDVEPGRLCHIRLQYTDESGVVKPLERGILSVKVTGGRLLGLGSACPYNETGYITDRTDTYYGEALAVVQAGEGAELTLAVTDGRYAGSVTIPVIR